MASFDLRACSLAEVRALCERFHGYKSAGNCAAYAFGVYEDGVLVAGFAWQPPPPGAARSICPEAPHGVLALSRMVAVPNGRRPGEVAQRRLAHVSKPLKYQMKREIDRTRWPVLVTYSDEGQGHTGYVYQCSGWRPTESRTAPVYETPDGKRASRYSCGVTNGRGALVRVGETTIQRWEHWICEVGGAGRWIQSHGWRRVEIPGKRWASGNQAYTYERG